MECDLCRAEKLTKWHYEDDIVYICDCKTCNIPMVVLKRHAKLPDKEEWLHIKWMINNLFPVTGSVDMFVRSTTIGTTI